MSFGGGDAPKPDKNIGRAALKQAEMGEQWLSFARDAFAISTDRQAEMDALTRRVTEQQLGIGEDAARWAREDRQRYETTFRPLEDEFVAEARDYASTERQGAAAAEAQADVQSAAAAQRAAARREAASVGIAPGSGRYAGIERAGELGTALATAGAANTARQRVRDKGLALKADAVNLGRGLPAQAAAGNAMTINAGNSAVGINAGANDQFLRSTGIMGQGFAGAQQGYAGQASTLNSQYQNQLSAYNAQNQSTAGLWGGIGTAAGLILSDENLKTDKTEMPEGTALEMVMDMPVEQWRYAPGIADNDNHVGPYAQDFAETTGKGDGKTIPVQDAIGITMKAVQDLGTKVDRLTKAVGIGGAAPATAKPKAKQAPIGLGEAA